MKNIRYIPILLLVTIIISSCNNRPKGDESSAQEAKEVQTTAGDLIYMINPNSSEIEWEGSKPTGKHNGVLEFKSGELEFKNDILVGGRFTIDMNTITCIDLEDPAYNKKLVNHLKSKDFFSVSKYPVSEFTITDVKSLEYTNKDIKEETTEEDANYMISGNLKIKNKTKNISFNALIMPEGDSLWAKSVPFVINRTDWGIKYNSPTMSTVLKDKLINDKIGIRIDIIATLKKE
ncbi:MAG: YceI family protein [Hyphomicrobiales bacterium]